jgi:hypothetical protein
VDRMRIAKIFRWAGRILACLASVLFMWALLGSTISNPSHWYISWPIEWFLVAFAALIVALGLILAWWEDLPAGIFLLAASLLSGFFINDFLHDLIAWLAIGLSFAVAGLLFTLAWLLSLKHGESKRD